MLVATYLEVDSGRPRDGEHVENDVGRATEDVCHHYSIHKGGLGHNVERLDVFLHKLAEVAADEGALPLLLGRDGGCAC